MRQRRRSRLHAGEKTNQYETNAGQGNADEMRCGGDDVQERASRRTTEGKEAHRKRLGGAQEKAWQRKAGEGDASETKCGNVIQGGGHGRRMAARRQKWPAQLPGLLSTVDVGAICPP